MNRIYVALLAELSAMACADDAPDRPGLQVVPLHNVVQISVGGSLARDPSHCALQDTGVVLCWGSNVAGQLGYPPSEPFEWAGNAQVVSGVSDVARVRAGINASCAVTRGGELWCWGESAQLDPRYIENGVPGQGPYRVQLGKPVADIAMGDFHRCALMVDGSVSCWGVDDFGQVDAVNREFCADSSMRLIREPNVTIASGATAVSAGRAHSCALVEGGAQCWGEGAITGKPFDPSVCTSDDERGSGQPSTQPGVRGVDSLDSGSRFACATGTAAFCWGYNENGQVGHSDDGVSAPFLIELPIISVAAAEEYACAVRADSTVSCWGQASPSSPPASAAEPRLLGGASDVVQLDGAGRRMCALSRAGTVTCFDAFRGENEFKGAPVLAVEPARP